MGRESDETKNSDAQILAQLRRRSQSAGMRQMETFDAEDEALDSAETTSDSDRSEALKRLVASRRAPKEPMSSLSPSLRNLRNDLIVESTSYSSETREKDASLDLLESDLTNGRERGAASTQSANAAQAEDVPPAFVSAPSPRVEIVESKREPVSDANSPRRNDDARELMVVSELKKGYVKGKKLIPVLQGVDLIARQGELLAVVGQSGSGKSTLLHLMATLDVPDSGTIHFDGQRIDNLPTSQRDVLRNRFIGMIFQFYHLIPEMTTLENVLAPLMIRDSIFGYMRDRSKNIERAKELLELVGLSHRLKHRPNELSGGEMQRASIARALIAEPRVLLADEPTGNLDSKASIEILNLLRRLNDEQKLTIVMVTHDMSQAGEADRAIRLVDGRVVAEEIMKR